MRNRSGSFGIMFVVCLFVFCENGKISLGYLVGSLVEFCIGLLFIICFFIVC